MAGSGRLSVDCGTKTLLLLQDLVKYYTDNSLKPSFPDLDTKLLYPFKQAAERKSSMIVFVTSRSQIEVYVHVRLYVERCLALLGAHILCCTKI